MSEEFFQLAREMVSRGIYVHRHYFETIRTTRLQNSEGEQQRRKIEYWYNSITERIDNDGFFRDSILKQHTSIPLFRVLSKTKVDERRCFMVSGPMKLANVELLETEIRMILKGFDPKLELLYRPDFSFRDFFSIKSGLPRKGIAKPIYWILYGTTRFSSRVAAHVSEEVFQKVLETFARELPGFLDYIREQPTDFRGSRPWVNDARNQILHHIWSSLVQHRNLLPLAVAHDEILLAVESKEQLYPLQKTLDTLAGVPHRVTISKHWGGDPIKTPRWKFLRFS